MENPKKQTNKQTKKSRINTGVAFSRWRELCNKLGHDRDSALACVF